jgi:hypothetical protein
MRTRRLVLCAVALLALAATAVVPAAMGARPSKPGRGGGGNSGGGDVPAQCRKYPEGSRQRDRCVQINDRRQAGAVTISALKLTPSTFKANPTASAPITTDPAKGTAVTFTLSAAGRVAFRVIRKVPNGGRKVNGKCKAKTRANARKTKCTLERAVGSFPYDGVAGANAFRWAGHAGRALKPGKYRLEGQPTSNRSAKAKAKANFKITK